MTPHPTADPGVTASDAPVLPPELGHLVRRGDRALAIGPGRLAVALAERTDQQVASVHETHACVEAVRAALGPRGRTGGVVDAQVGDLTAGRPETGPYDVIVVTAGITALSPRWFTQLSARGVIVAPVALGGLHPWLVVGADRYDRTWYGQVLGVDPGIRPLSADGALGRRPEPAVPAGADDPRAAAQWASLMPSRLSATELTSMWLWLATREARTTGATVPGTGWGPVPTVVAESGAVHVTPRGLWLTDTGPATMALAQDVAGHIQRWTLRCPAPTDLTCRLDLPAATRSGALLTPADWTADRVVTLPR
ncbi:hypothetical protein [Kitasatospora sp. NPDC059160]|uniref:hypothetical protein n=1 Tax=Kitasatospora sp. NPDC059160 TaxID=3346748 RepID=UPI0036B2CDB4